MNSHLPKRVEISPEVLTNSWLLVLSDIPNERDGNREYSLIKEWKSHPWLLAFGLNQHGESECVRLLYTSPIVAKNASPAASR